MKLIMIIPVIGTHLIELHRFTNEYNNLFERNSIVPGQIIFLTVIKPLDIIIFVSKNIAIKMSENVYLNSIINVMVGPYESLTFSRTFSARISS